MPKTESLPTHFAVLFRPGAHAQAAVVRASARRDQGGTVRFYEEEALVWMGPLAQIVDVVECADRRTADLRCREHREQMAGAGAATFTLQESGVVPRGRRGHHRRGNTAIPAEGIRVVLED